VSLHAARIALSRVIIVLLVDLAAPNTPLDERNDSVLAVGAVEQRTIAIPRRVARRQQSLLDPLFEVPVCGFVSCLLMPVCSGEGCG
jgi:hypothetical protein